MIDFGREVCGFLPASERREWLVTNGIGGFTSGTVSGLLTRRYHGLLVAALKPPLGRTLLVSKLDEFVTYDDREYVLSTDRWEGDSVQPTGYRHIERFRLEGTTPVWTYACADALLEKRIWMARDANTTYVHYTLLRASRPLYLRAKALVNDRDFHGSTQAKHLQMTVEPVAHGLKITASSDTPPFYILSDSAAAAAEHNWYQHYELSIERERGFEGLDDHLHAGWFTVTLQPGESVTFTLTTEESASLDGRAASTAQLNYENDLIASAGLPLTLNPAEQVAAEQLILSADQFIVRRTTGDGKPGHSIIAGYPWFGDWGRDTMISLPGLTLTTHRYDVAASILRTFAHYVDKGMLPNRFPDQGETPEYNTVDATLWYFEAIRATFAATHDLALLRDLLPVLESIIDWHLKGTRYHIHVDPADGLLYSGEAGVQLTWMDVKIGDWVVTPRTGKAVEINALWYNALRSMAEFANALGQDATRYIQLAKRVQASFGKFWNATAGYCYDVLDTPAGNDPTLRPNQLFAVSLPHSPLSTDQQRAVVDICARHLLTSHGLRSLAPDHPDYKGFYGGTPVERDSVYHQGTVWGWLIGPFVDAYRRVYQDDRAAQAFLIPLLQQMNEHALNSISEIFDGDAPFMPRG
ncbi:MAG: amylo-alpha-1,6-glucosidase, partial [Anaerolineae bacterium]|nr:amylo-alpha-1,6-glucosidase [Anaerolineae bacterium]